MRNRQSKTVQGLRVTLDPAARTVTVTDLNYQTDYQERRFDTEVQARLVANQAVYVAERLAPDPSDTPLGVRAVRTMSRAISRAQNSRAWAA